MSSLAVGGCVAFKSHDTHKYVCCMRGHGPFSNTLKASGENALTPYTRFYIEPSKEDESLVHIRSCYNNKYWVPSKVNDSWYILVDGKEQEENILNPSCTLFKIHQYGHFVQIITCSAEFTYGDISIQSTPPHINKVTPEDEGCLVVITDDDRHTNKIRSIPSENMFTVINLDDQKVLPKYVRFKGDNGKYLGIHNGNFLKFGWTDSGDDKVIHSIHTNPDGTMIRIKSEKVGMFWRLGNNCWIAADCDDNTSRNNQDTWFQVVRLGGNMIALKNVGNKKFSKGLTNDDAEECLNAWGDSIAEFARLQLEEAVVTRKIYSVEYDLAAARVYDHKALVMATAHSVNNSSTPTTAKLNLKYSLATTSSWSKSTTESWGVKASINVGLPKLLSSIGVELDINIEGHYDHTYTEEYGGSHTRTEEQSVDYDMTVPPKTKMTLQATATQASCDIPYSYYQKDILTNGDTVVSKLDDGLFHGVNSYEFTYNVTEEKLLDEATQQGTEESRKKRKQGEPEDMSMGDADGFAPKEPAKSK